MTDKSQSSFKQITRKELIINYIMFLVIGFSLGVLLMVISENFI